MAEEDFRLDVKLCFGASLFDGGVLRDLEQVIRRNLAQWGGELAIFEARERRAIRKFAEDVRESALVRGPLYQQMVAEQGAGAYQRRSGTVEIRGANRDLILIVGLDDCVLAPLAGKLLWGNTVTFQVCKSRLECNEASEVARRIMLDACAQLSPVYARAQMSEEWFKKNMSSEGGGLRAIGVDASRCLPGLYWLNYFGKQYVELMGREKLLTAPTQTEELSGGAAVQLSSDPRSWNTEEYLKTESAVLSHLGRQFFFDRAAPERFTVAPGFGQ